MLPQKYPYYQNPLSFLPLHKFKAIKLVQPSKDRCRSTLFLVAKKDTGQRPVINLTKVELVNPIQTLQNKRSISLEKNSPLELLCV